MRSNRLTTQKGLPIAAEQAGAGEPVTQTEPGGVALAVGYSHPSRLSLVNDPLSGTG